MLLFCPLYRKLRPQGYKKIILTSTKHENVGILTLISMINTTAENFTDRIVFIFQHFSYLAEFEIPCSSELSMKNVL